TVIARLENFPIKPSYDTADIELLLSEDFETGTLIARLFLGLSKDAYEAELRGLLGAGGIGVKRFQSNTEEYVAVLEQLGLLGAIQEEVNRVPKWSDVLVERLRSGRGSAVAGQKRGRHVEDFVESVVQNVFGTDYETRCTFIGQRGRT